MRKPKKRFPFIISPYQSIKNKAIESVSAEKGKSSPIPEILSLLEKILSQSVETQGKLSGLYKKLGFLESEMDDFLNRESAGGEHLNKDFFIRIIPILDDFEAIKQMAKELGPEEWREGIASFYNKLINCFETYNFKPAAEIGMIFNSSYHESVGIAEESKLNSGSIAEVIQQGWLYGEEILRFAKVIMVKKINKN